MGLIVKICGLTSVEALDTALDAGADMVGLVRFAPSPRHIGLDAATLMSARASGRAERVLVTVDMPDDELDATLAAVQPDWIQFHGHESPDHVARTRARTGIRALKALGIADEADLDAAERYADACDMLLLDTKPPKDASRPGGLGVAFDWGLAARRPPKLPYLLSGGLGPDNVAAAIAATGAPGVDVSSGVERAPGDKDPAKVRAFIAAARQAASEPTREPTPASMAR